MEPAGFPLQFGLKREFGQRLRDSLLEPVKQRERPLHWPLLRVLARLPELRPLHEDDLLQAMLGALWRFFLLLARLKRLLEQREQGPPRKHRLPKPQQVARVWRQMLQRFAEGVMRPLEHLFL